ncbi:histidine kinase [Elizabethkingia meningoseptica]|uniref:sensor histidine kinase n=1 Tax=Elizabethkingia meningoseptica TaxID=238 RepID=UPI0022F156B3|nr:histidine kinase [Elizabethkingia meningoseptica]EJK5328119.1 histidine kinase [Elizabethkingia meningoseptica]WBS74117.1 histidine kinase [Elizabethkingia meningoseptica]
MKREASLKKITLLNWLVASVAGVVVLLFQLLGDSQKFLPYLALMGFVIVFGVSTVDLKILKRVRINPSQKYWWYLLSYFCSASIYLLCWPPFSLLHHTKWEYNDYSLLSILLLSSVILNTIVLLIQHFLLLQQEKSRTEIEMSMLKAANMEASNLLLRQQIQPHFLFNSLSNLKALYKEDPEAGEAYIVHLANFLRISFSNQKKKVSQLSEEIDFLNDYLEMQKIRFGEGLKFNVNVSKQHQDLYFLPSFSLQLLAENAIKHNELTNELPLLIEISVENESIKVANSRRYKRNPEVSTGQGLANLRDRYDLISGDKIVIKQSENEFIVTLKLLSNENINY